MSMNNSYPTTVYESIFSQMYIFVIEKYYIQFQLRTLFMVGDLTSSVRQTFCLRSYTPFIQCSQNTVVRVHVNIFL